MSDLTLRAENLTLGYRDRSVLEDLTLSLPPGRVTTILGPNGCGKSTLLWALARLIVPLGGRVTLGGEDVRAQNTRALARQLAILPQAPLAPDGITVGELVRRGRAPWRGVLAPWSAADERACARALDAVAIAELADRPLGELSGGQRQRAWIALVLAQDTPVLLLDEPTTWLDLPHQIEVLRLLRRRNREAGTTIVCVLHDLNLAAQYADQVALLHQGRVVASGAPAQVFTPDYIHLGFGIEVELLAHPSLGHPLIVPTVSMPF